MDPLNKALDVVRAVVRSWMKLVAKALNSLSGGHLSPNIVTITGVLAHIPIAVLIATGYYRWAAILLVVFGLFDALDGELARLQNRASPAGMLLDATTDRVKEVMLYSGAAYNFVSLGRPYMSVWALIATGCSLLVSYVKAKGETAIASSGLPHHQINRLFQDGLMRFEVRMGLLVIGLLSGRLIIVVIIIAVLSGLTALGRLIKISRKLKP